LNPTHLDERLVESMSAPVSAVEVHAATLGESPSEKEPVARRNLSLDVLRCVAIMLVLGRHVDHYWFWNRIGWIGVDLFFVLSGFLVSGLLFQEFKNHGHIDIRRFIFRRGLKIWPAFYVYIGVTATITALIQWQRNAHFPVRSFAVTSLFLSNYFPGGPRLFAHIWSLAIEEHFYLVLPFLLAGVILCSRRKNPFSSIPWIFTVISIACLSLRITTEPRGIYYWTTHTRIDSLFAGVTVSYFYHFNSAWFARLTGNYALWIATVCCLPVAFFTEESRIMQTIGLSLLYVGFSFLLAWAVIRTPSTKAGIPVARMAAAIGFYSYSIYLWHRLFAFVLSNYPSTLAFWAYIVLAIGMGVVMSKLVELPALRLRAKWKLTA